MAQQRIVVGYDSSPGAHAALRWAAEEARLRGASLDVVHAWTYYVVGATGLMPVDPTDLEAAAGTVLDEALAELGTVRGVEVNRRLTEGPAAQALLHAAEGADLLVVGSRGRGGFAGLLLGSVSQQVSHHARCPVVIVPAPADD